MTVIAVLSLQISREPQTQPAEKLPEVSKQGTAGVAPFFPSDGLESPLIAVESSGGAARAELLQN
jgi:hypothetical protein